MVKNLKNSGLVKKTDNVLDYGCGAGAWDNEATNHGIFFNKLYLYDKNPEIREYCKKKYPNHTVVNDVSNELDVNLIFSNSVIQYIDINNLKKLFEQFAALLKKDEMVIISCLPQYPRVLECILTFFCDFNIDQYYSYGIGLVLTFKSEKLAGLQNYFPSKKAYFFEAGLKVEGYTPSVKKISNFDNSNTTFDRPFAGILYGTLDVTYIFERSFFKGGILLGVLGPASMADEFQGWFHKNISDDITFDGWQFQIPNQPLLNLNFTYGYDFLPNQSWFNLFGVSQTRVGNLYIDATPIIGLRIGKFHKLSESVSMGNNIVSNSKRTELFFQSTISGTVSLFNATAQGNLFNNNFEFALESVNTFHSTISSGIYFSSSRFSGGLDHFFTFNKVLPVQHTYARAILKYRF